MSDVGPLEPLDEDVLALLDEAKEFPELPSATKDALLAAIGARLPTPPVPDGGAGGGAAGGGEPGRGGGAASPPTLMGGLGARALATLATTFAIGAGVGIGLDRAVLVPSPAPAATVAVAAAASTPEAPRPAATASGPVIVPIDALPAVPPTLAPPSPARRPEQPLPSPSSRGLAAERGLLDVARAALGRGAPDEALAAAERHRSEYRDGVLAEEREALAIKALAALGRREEAKARADAFERRYPNALGLRAVRAAAAAESP